MTTLDATFFLALACAHAAGVVHFEEAGLAEDAIKYLLRAGQAHMPVAAFLEARTLFERAVRLSGTLPESTARDARELELRASLGGAQVVTMGYSAPELEANAARASSARGSAIPRAPTVHAAPRRANLR